MGIQGDWGEEKKQHLTKVSQLFLTETVWRVYSTNHFSTGHYRPISLLLIYNCSFEKLLYRRLIKFIDKNDILYDLQYGFRNKHSTQHAILDIVNTIHSNMDNREYSCGIFLDLKKTFDTVNHEILLTKLEHYGMRGVINSWFRSYLSDRRQSIEIDKCISETETIVCGVPQGSVLGPLLFLLLSMTSINPPRNLLFIYSKMIQV